MTGIILVGIFVTLAVMMYLGKMPALLALPVLALTLTMAAGVPYYWQQLDYAIPWQTRFVGAVSQSMHLTFGTVVTDGVPRLQIAIFTVMLGGIFGHFLKLSGVCETLVRKVAELAGDSPFSLSLILTVVVSFLFMTLSGLGSVILVANIYFPVLLSLGVPPLVTGCLFLMGFSFGGVFNIVNWQFFIDLLQLRQEDVMKYAVPFGALFFAALLVFLVVEFKRQRLPVPASSLAKVLGVVAVIAGLAAWFKSSGPANPAIKDLFIFGYIALLLIMFAAPLLSKRFSWAAMLTPFVPISLVLLLGWNITPAFLMGILYLFVTTIDRKVPGSLSKRSKMVIQSVIEGIQSVTPAVALMMGKGMVLIAVTQPPVKQCLNPLLLAVLPTGKIGYVLFFTILAPLALYRGPLNLWGMGAGFMGLIKQTALLSDISILAAFFSTGQIQGVCDPTNTANVWVANELKIDINAILRKTLPYMWALTFLGLILGAYAG